MLLNDVVLAGYAPPGSFAELDALIALPEDERLRILQLVIAGPDGLGLVTHDHSELTALTAFTRWERDSRRLDPRVGSAYWRAVNGRLIADVGMAALGIESDSPGVEVWSQYLAASAENSDDAGALFWIAHQISLHEGHSEARELFHLEDPAEQRLIESVIANVDQTAFAYLIGVDLFAAESDFGHDGVALFTSTVYPDTYPVSSVEVAAAAEQPILAPFLDPEVYLFTQVLFGPGSPIDWRSFAD